MLIGTFYHVAATSFAAYNNLKFCNETVHMYKLVYYFFFENSIYPHCGIFINKDK